jgi:hypothetical protein
VLHSLFEEQLREEADLNARLVDAGTESFADVAEQGVVGADVVEVEVALRARTAVLPRLGVS